MHSTALRGSDFHLTCQGRPIAHAAFFGAVEKTDRLGLFAPDRCEGAGAIALIMACATAFYDRHRAVSESFFAYPDYFTFQRQSPLANYAMCDIWPRHKNVHVPDNANETAAAITDRGIDILLVPDRPPREHAFEPVQQAANHRNIRRCFLYGATGQVEAPTLDITCAAQPIATWALAMLDSLPEPERPQSLYAQWQAIANQKTLHQSFREISLEEALQRL